MSASLATAQKGGTGAPLTIAVTSGKGGVGKSQLVASLAVVLSQEGNRTLLLDADVGCGNLDVILGVAPEHDLRAVIKGELAPDQVVTRASLGDTRVDMLAAPAADVRGSELEAHEQLTVIDAVKRVGQPYQVVLIDTGAGVSRNPMLFGAAADRILVVTTPDPAAIKDAYAAIKVLHQAHKIEQIDLVVNQTQGPRDGRRVYGQLSSVVDRFLPVELRLLGSLPHDDRVVRSVRAREPATYAYPSSDFSQAVRGLATRLLAESDVRRSGGQVRYFSARNIGGGDS